MSSTKEIGQRIRALRLKAEESQEKLAHATGVSVGTISRWERGQDRPRATALSLLAAHYETSTDHILNGSPHEQAKPPVAWHKFLQTHLGRIALDRNLEMQLLHLVRAWPREPTIRTFEKLTSALLEEDIQSADDQGPPKSG